MAYKILETCIGCTACTKRCPTDAITGVRNAMHIIDPELCIDCGACGVVCPVECIADEHGDLGKGFPRREWPKAIVIDAREGNVQLHGYVVGHAPERPGASS